MTPGPGMRDRAAAQSPRAYSLVKHQQREDSPQRTRRNAEGRGAVLCALVREDAPRPVRILLCIGPTNGGWPARGAGGTFLKARGTHRAARAGAPGFRFGV